MKKSSLLFLFLAMLVGCKNLDTDMYAPTASSSADQDQLAVQNASGTTINFFLEDETAMASDATLTMDFNTAFHWFDGRIVCSTSFQTDTPTHVDWSADQLAYGEFPMAAKLEVNMDSQEQVISATVSFQSSSTSEIVVQLTKQANNKYLAEFDLFSSEFCQKLQSMFMQMGDQMTECSIRVKMGISPAPAPAPDLPNPVTGSWVSSSKEAVLTAKYPVGETMIVDYFLGDGIYVKYYPNDNSFLSLIIPKGETTVRAYLPEYDNSLPFTQVFVLSVNPKPDFYDLLSGSWVAQSKEVVFTLKQPVRWALTVDYFIINPTGIVIYPTKGTHVTITIPQGQTSARVFLPDFEESQQSPMIHVSDIRFKYVY